MDSHFEATTRLIDQSQLERVRKLVKELGPARSIARVLSDPKKRVDALSLLLRATVEYAFRRVRDPFDSLEIDRHPFVREFSQALSERLPADFMGSPTNFQGSIVTSVMEVWQQLCHDAAGRRVYEVSEGLAQRLSHTELRGLRADDLRLPYRNIYVCVPPTTHLQIFNEDSGLHRVLGFFITESVFYAGQSAEPVPSWNLFFIGERKGDSEALDFALFRFVVPLHPGQDIDTILERELERVAQLRTGYLAVREWFQGAFRDLFKWAMNVVCYATMPDCVSEYGFESGAAQALWEKAQHLPDTDPNKFTLRAKAEHTNNARPRIRLGRGIQVWTDVEGGLGKGSPLLRRSLVQGHWRNQAYGEKHSLRRRQWIEPFWRGPNDAVEEPQHHVLV